MIYAPKSKSSVSRETDHRGHSLQREESVMQLKKKSDARVIDRKILLVVVPERKLILPAIKTTSNAKQEASQDNIFTVKLEKRKL